MKTVKAALYLYWKHHIFQIWIIFGVTMWIFEIIQVTSKYLSVIYVIPISFAVFQGTKILRTLNKYHFNRIIFYFPLVESVFLSFFILLFCYLLPVHLTIFSYSSIFLLSCSAVYVIGKSQNGIVQFLLYVILLTKVVLSI